MAKKKDILFISGVGNFLLFNPSSFRPAQSTTNPKTFKKPMSSDSATSFQAVDRSQTQGINDAPVDAMMHDRLDKWTAVSPSQLLATVKKGDWITYTRVKDWKVVQDNERVATTVVVDDINDHCLSLCSTPPKKNPAHSDQPRRIFHWSFSWSPDDSEELKNEALRGRFHRRHFYVRTAQPENAQQPPRKRRRVTKSEAKSSESE
jgi:hypothetical protein